MKEDSYLDAFLDVDELPTKHSEENVLFDWITHENSSYAAYQAILSLKLNKKAYIKKHKLKSHYLKKSNYLIQKSEVARLVNKKAQPLFNSNSYSIYLRNFFDKSNRELEKEKDLRINRLSTGIGNKRKEDLVIEHKALINTHKENQSQTVDDLYQKLLDNMPLDIKRRLKLPF
jgi:hypothetical protein